MREIAKDSRVKAYGEIGLDFFRNLAPPEIQISAFRQQLRLARDIGLPVVIHDRDAHTETLKILQEEGGGKLKGLIHCFSGDIVFADHCLEMGFYVSFPGTITFPKAREIRDVIRHVPLDRVLIETDCPFLAPEPFRGRRNEPSYVRYVAEKIAEIRGISFESVGRITSKNATDLFKIHGEAQ
jgi:TatD DNase family protein